MVQQSNGDDPLPVTRDSHSTEAPRLGSHAEGEADFATLDIKVQEQLGKVFRAYCDDLIHQPIPEKFVVLLAKLEAKQREK